MRCVAINNLVKLKELSLTFIYELISSRQFQLPVTQGSLRPHLEYYCTAHDHFGVLLEESDLYDGQLPEINIWDNATLCGLLLECFGSSILLSRPSAQTLLVMLLQERA
ncbi:hypothetical protein Zmor_027092 [Zophobas morio]|uniref:Uncharacterized protein n=1 Tax=Zophobas morio TaxID=2755281 RepID=A0AA38HJH0_9CUCU|nr:hypothetical protein Zmor_027092 [Zophobas morio]